MSALSPISFKSGSNITAKKISVFSNEKEEERQKQPEEDILEIMRQKAYSEAYEKGLADAQSESEILISEKLDLINNLISELSDEISETRKKYVSANIEILRAVLSNIVDEEVFGNDGIAPNLELSGDRISIDPSLADNSIKILSNDSNINIDIKEAIENKLNNVLGILSND